MKQIYSGNKDLPEQTWLLMRALEAKTGDRFQTHFFPQTDGDDGPVLLAWREAWRNPVTKSWEISDHQTMQDHSGAGGVSERKRTLHNDLCFFDALYHCGLFEAGAAQFGSAPVEKTFENNQSHYIAFGEKEAVPFDWIGLPLLAAYGRILTDGDYDARAREVASRSPMNPKLPEPRDILEFSSRNLPVPVAGAAKDLSVKAEWNRAVGRKEIELLRKKMANVETALDRCRNHGFVWCRDHAVFWLPLSVVGTICLLHPLYWQGMTYNFPRSKFHRAVRQLRSACNKAAGPVDIAALEQYADDAVLTYHVLRAREQGRGFVNSGKGGRRMDKCIHAFRKAAAGDGWNEQKIEDMVALIKHDVTSTSTDYELCRQLGQTRNKIDQSLSALGQAL